MKKRQVYRKIRVCENLSGAKSEGARKLRGAKIKGAKFKGAQTLMGTSYD